MNSQLTKILESHRSLNSYPLELVETQARRKEWNTYSILKVNHSFSLRESVQAAIFGYFKDLIPDRSFGNSGFLGNFGFGVSLKIEIEHFVFEKMNMTFR